MNTRKRSALEENPTDHRRTLSLARWFYLFAGAPFLAPELSESALKPIIGARVLAILGDSVT
jgi:hypothetical protein